MPFITFEGVEGCGKSTQLRLLDERLRAAGSRRPRDPRARAARRSAKACALSSSTVRARRSIPIAEWLLFEADRRQHLAEVIRPALAAGAWILCDRFSDSTEAYQSAGRGLDAAFIDAVDGRVRDGIRPDLTLLYDLDVAEGLARTRRRDAREDRFESEELAFHERVRGRFLEIARREPRRVVVVPAHGDAAAVFAETSRIVAERFAR